MRALCVFVVVATFLGCGSDSETSTPPPDSRSQALSYATDDLACASEADCCVVFDGCKGKGLIVAAKDQSKVAELLKSASQDMCVGCIPPWVQIKCTSGKCSAVAITPGSGGDINAGQSFSQNHCGTLPLPTGWTEPQSIMWRQPHNATAYRCPVHLRG